MNARTLLALLSAAALAGGACIQESRPVAHDTSASGDTVAPGDTHTQDTSVTPDGDGPDTSDAVTCTSNGECSHLVGSSCEIGRCGDGGTCVVEEAPDETVCGDPGSCDGQTWTPPPRCASGSCVPGDPVVCAALPGSCEKASCEPATGCTTTRRQDGDPCVTGVGALKCVDNTWHPQDYCDQAGSCVDSPAQRCAGGFCQAPICDAAAGCGTQPVGVALPEVTGAWRFVLLRYVPGLTRANRDVYAARGTLDLGADGKWSRDSVQTSAVGAFPVVGTGNYCVAGDGAIAIALGTENGAQNELYGQLTPTRDLFFAVSHQRPELVVAVKQASTPAASSGAARYHMLGVVKKAATAELYAIDGVLSFGTDGCLDRDATYQRSDQQPVVTIPASGACLVHGSDGQVAFPHTESVNDGVAIPISLSGYTLASRDVMVLALDTATDVFPSLVILVREGPDVGPSALAGKYLFGGLEAGDTTINRAEGGIVYDGTGLVTSYHATVGGAEVNGGGGPQDRYTVALATSGDAGDLAGGYSHDVAVQAARDRRFGHIAPRGGVSNLSPVVVHVPATATWHLEPGLQIAVRKE